MSASAQDFYAHLQTELAGIREAGWVEITSGLAIGDQIVTRAGSFVADGDKINPVQATN